MNRRLTLILVVLAFTLIVVLPTTAQNQLFDLQAAIAAAQPGDTILVPPGAYAGPLLIDKPVTLEGQGMPVIDSGGQGDVVTISAPDVTLRGFVIRNSGTSLDRENAGITGTGARVTIENNRLEDVLFGIYLKDAPGSIVRNNTVHGKDLEMGVRGDGLRLWYCADSLLEGNHVADSRDMIVWFSPNTIVRGNVVERSRYGLHFMVNENDVAENNVLRDNSVGIYLMYGDDYIVRNNLLYNNRGQSGYGLALKDVNGAVIEGNYIVSNRVGIYNDNSPLNPEAAVRVENNLLAYNDLGLDYLPLVQRNTFTENVFQENGAQVSIAGQGELKGNFWAEAGRGNYWSDYAGFDADGDHVGDLPYKSQSLYEDLMESYPELRLFQLSPASDAIDLAARAFPIFQPRPNMADQYPLMAPPELPAVPGLARPPVIANLVIALGMMGVAALVLVLGVKSSWRITRKA